MEITSAVDFFRNSKWQPYEGFVTDYVEFVKKYYSENPEKSIETAIDFFVELMTTVAFEQERANYLGRVDKDEL